MLLVVFVFPYISGTIFEFIQTLQRTNTFKYQYINIMKSMYAEIW